MNPQALEEWLKKRPRPKKLRLGLADGETREIMLKPGQQWKTTVESVLALAPDTIEAFTAENTLLRATSQDTFQADEPKEDGDAREVVSSKEILSQSLANVQQDAGSAQLLLFAQLLADAYRHSTDVAFARMVDVFEQMNNRQLSVERTIEVLQKSLKKSVEQQLERVEQAGDTDLADEMMKAFLMGGQMKGGEA